METVKLLVSIPSHKPARQQELICASIAGRQNPEKSDIVQWNAENASERTNFSLHADYARVGDITKCFLLLQQSCNYSYKSAHDSWEFLYFGCKCNDSGKRVGGIHEPTLKDHIKPWCLMDFQLLML